MAIDVRINMRLSFFDKPEVMRRVEEKRRKGMVRAGALVMTIARRSMKKARRKRWDELTPREKKLYGHVVRGVLRKNPKVKLPYKSAEPGQPPKYRTKLLRDRTFFAYDEQKDDVVIGPEWGGGSETRNADLLENSGSRVLTGFGGKPVLMHFKGNPFMQPALMAAKSKVPALFKG